LKEKRIATKTAQATKKLSNRYVPVPGSVIVDIYTELSTDGGLTWQPSLSGLAAVILLPQD
jgi:hypothetical protein